jgi:glucuronoarabinoxylan endo-1,4-beta-xylanase
MQQRTLVALKTIAWLVLLSSPLAAQAQTVTPTATINWTDVHQTMDGFGSQTWLFANSIPDATADLFFSPTAGIGMAYVRTANTSDGSIPDLVTLQKAVARGALVELSLQSPPASMKVSGSFTNGAGGIITAQYSAYATYIVNYINTLASNGAPVAVLSVQNEPDISSSGLGATIWSASQFDTFVGTYLGPALASAGLHPKVMLGEMSSWFDNDLVSTCLNDATCAQYVSIVAAHGYGVGGVDGTNNNYCCHTATAFAPGTANGRHLWMSETGGGLIVNGGNWSWDPSMADALVWAHSIHDYFTVANASAWEYWELAYQSANFGLTDASFTPAQRFYVVGNFSKFIRPGWVRIGATANPVGGVYVSAYKDPSSGNFAIVAINQNGTAVPLNFVLNGFPAASVTPWVTSASLDLAQQPSISAGGGAFSGTLLASSVTTFDSKLSSTPLAPPTNLNATVH